MSNLDKLKFVWLAPATQDPDTLKITIRAYIDIKSLTYKNGMLTAWITDDNGNSAGRIKIDSLRKRIKLIEHTVNYSDGSTKWDAYPNSEWESIPKKTMPEFLAKIFADSTYRKKYLHIAESNLDMTIKVCSKVTFPPTSWYQIFMVTENPIEEKFGPNSIALLMAAKTRHFGTVS